MASKNYIVVKSKITTTEFKQNLVRKIRKFISSYNVAFIEHPLFEKLEIIQPSGFFIKEVGELENASNSI